MEQADLTLDEVRALLAPAIADVAAFDGWSGVAIADAAKRSGVHPDVARLAYPNGAMDMIAAWIDTTDRAMADAFSDGRLESMKMRDRIRALVGFRLEAVAGREEALRRAIAIMAMPQNAKAALKRGWRSADLMWRLAGDTATDLNHYSKRATLSAIYAATLDVLVDDHSEGKADTLAFLDRRIDGIIRFEKAKAQFVRPADEHFSMARFLGRLRYPAR